ncbi:MAG: hypothetical protein H5T33_00600 [Candidatus Methanosuratus sp.]|nr:hypothetical protein [Candidatus Methanosuratincola sp.]
MGNEELEFVLAIPVILAILALNIAAFDLINSQIEALDSLHEEFEIAAGSQTYVIDNATGNVYPEVSCRG